MAAAATTTMNSISINGKKRKMRQIEKVGVKLKRRQERKKSQKNDKDYRTKRLFSLNLLVV